MTVTTVTGAEPDLRQPGNGNVDANRAACQTDSNGNPSDGNQPTTITAVAGGGGAIAAARRAETLVARDRHAAAPASSSPGDTLLYTITVANNGSASATNVHLTDPVPTCTGALNPCTSFVAGSLVTSQGAIVSTAPIDVNLGTMAPGATAQRLVPRAGRSRRPRTAW